MTNLKLFVEWCCSIRWMKGAFSSPVVEEGWNMGELTKRSAEWQLGKSSSSWWLIITFYLGIATKHPSNFKTHSSILLSWICIHKYVSKYYTCSDIHTHTLIYSIKSLFKMVIWYPPFAKLLAYDPLQWRLNFPSSSGVESLSFHSFIRSVLLGKPTRNSGFCYEKVR